MKDYSLPSFSHGDLNASEKAKEKKGAPPKATSGKGSKKGPKKRMEY